MGVKIDKLTPQQEKYLASWEEGTYCTSRMRSTRPSSLASSRPRGVLPISSSAHLILVPWVLGWDDPASPSTSRSTGARSSRSSSSSGATGSSSSRRSAIDRRSQVPRYRRPPALLGPRRLLDSRRHRGKAPRRQGRGDAAFALLIAVTMSIMGVLLWVADSAGKRTSSRADDAAAGAGHRRRPAFALLPGVSRSGSTITVGLALGYSREAIARFSFLMSTPIISVPACSSFQDAARDAQRRLAARLGRLAAGCIASAIVGCSSSAGSSPTCARGPSLSSPSIAWWSRPDPGPLVLGQAMTRSAPSLPQIRQALQRHEPAPSALPTSTGGWRRAGAAVAAARRRARPLHRAQKELRAHGDR